MMICLDLPLYNSRPLRDQSLFMYRRGEGRKEGGVKAISDWLEGGANLFYIEV